MSQEEVEAVLAHEVSHVANGDMVTMTLLQGVLNTFVIFLARVVGTVIDRAISGNRDNGGGGIAYFLIVMVLQVVLGILASVIVMAFSRWREFRADAGSARLSSKQKMISALERLGQGRGENSLPSAIQAFGIAGGGMRKLFSSHPPIEERIAALRKAG
jgi:heat shock protein HtpX